MPKRLGELSARHVIFTIGITKEGKIVVGHASLERLQRTGLIGLKSGEHSSVSEPERLERIMKRRKTTFKDGVIEYLLVCFSFSFFLTFSHF